MTVPSRWGLGLIMSVALGVSALPVQAQQEAEAVDKAAARALAVEGVRLAREGRCAEAIDKLERAEKLYHSAVVLAQLGECYIEQGRLVEGTEALRSVLREPPPEHPSAAVASAHAQAAAQVEATLPKIASLTLTVANSQADRVRVFVDGHRVRKPLLGVVRPTDPGDHVIEARGEGLLTSRQSLTLRPGEKRSLRIELEPAEGVGAAAASEVAGTDAVGDFAAGALRGDPAASRAPPMWAAYLAFGVAGGSLAVGITAALVGSADGEASPDVCVDAMCPPETSDQDLAADRTRTLVSTVGFGFAAMAAITGGLLWWAHAHGRGSPASSTEPTTQPPIGMRVRPGVSGIAVDF